MANTYELIVKTVDKSSRSLNNIDGSLKKLGRTAKLAGAALAGIAAGQVARGIVNQYREFERYRTVLTTFLGSSQKANAELQRLQTLANSLPQDLQDITQAFTILSRNGIDTSSESLTAFSNIATANAKSFTQLGEAVADALTGEFERLKEFGIKVSRENDGFVARIGDQQVAVAKTSTDLVRQLRSLGEEGGKFGGAAAANADTLDQSFSNLQGALFETSVTIGEQLRPALKGVVDDTAALLRNNEELVKSFGVGLGEAIKGTANAIKFLAANFDLIRDAALTLIFIRMAGSVANLTSKISSFTAGAKGFTGFFSGAKKAVTSFAMVIPRLIGSVTGLSAVLGVVARMTPIGRAISIGLAVATGAMALLRDKTFQVGETTTTVSEVVQAGFFAIRKIAVSVANTIGSAYKSVVEQISSFFSQGFGADIMTVFRTIGEFVLTVANAMIGYHVVAYRSIVGIFQNLPSAFVEIFKSIGAVSMDFGGRLVSQFGNIGSALLKAIQAPFSSDVSIGDALNDLTTNAFAGLGASIKEDFAPVSEGISSALQGAKEALSENYIENAMGAIGESVENTVLEFREYQEQVERTAAAMLPYDDAILRIARSQATAKAEADALAASIAAQAEAAAAAVPVLTGYQKFMNEILTSASNSAAQIQYATAAGDNLNEMFRMGQITGEEYSIALERVNQILGVDTPEAAGTAGNAIATVASTYRDATDAIDAFNLKQTNTSGALSKLENDFKGGNINLQEFRVGMESMGAGMKDISDKSIVMGMTITDAFTSAGDSLASGLAQGIMRGEGIMNSFKGFMSSILETILTQIIQQAFIGPLISSMTSGLGQAFSAFGGGGAGAFGGGGFGSMIGGSLFGPIGGFLGGLFNFADGGVVPGRATSGDSIPAMLTPGEVILNKGQQAAVMSNNNNEPVTVNFNMNTIDSRSGTEFILQNKQQITSVIQQAYNTRGQSGPLG